MSRPLLPKSYVSTPKELNEMVELSSLGTSSDCDFDPPLSLLSYFLCCWCSGFVFVLLGVVGLGFEEGFVLVFGLRFERELR